MLVGVFGYGFIVHRDRMFPYHYVRAAWQVIRPAQITAPSIWRRTGRNEARFQSEASAEVLSVPYLQGYSPATGAGVKVRTAEAWQGVNLYTSGDQPRAVLIDMDGRPLHAWTFAFSDLRLPLPDEAKGYDAFWTAVLPLPNGDLLAVFNDIALIRLDSRSRLLWKIPGRFHHTVSTRPGGGFLALTRRRHVIPRINTDAAVLEDFVVEIDDLGQVLRETSMLDAFERSSYASLLSQVDRWNDVLHTNFVHVIEPGPGLRAPFQAGRWLVSSPRLNTVAVVDPQAGKVWWALTGLFSTQHHPSLLANGNLLVFDNRGQKGSSRVVEIEPFTQQVVWQYPPDGGVGGLFSACCGSAERLPNGNTLILESTGGRAIEVTSDHHVVWEFSNPAHHPSDPQLVATVFDFLRLDRSWLDAIPGHSGRRDPTRD